MDWVVGGIEVPHEIEQDNNKGSKEQKDPIVVEYLIAYKMLHIQYLMNI